MLTKINSIIQNVSLKMKKKMLTRLKKCKNNASNHDISSLSVELAYC